MNKTVLGEAQTLGLLAKDYFFSLFLYIVRMIIFNQFILVER